MEADPPRRPGVNQRYDKDHDRHNLDREASIARSKKNWIRKAEGRKERSAVATNHFDGGAEPTKKQALASCPFSTAGK